MANERVPLAEDATQLRNRLLKIMNSVDNNEMGLAQANTDARLGRTIIAIAVGECKYNAQYRIKTKIDFFEQH